MVPIIVWADKSGALAAAEAMAPTLVSGAEPYMDAPLCEEDGWPRPVPCYHHVHAHIWLYILAFNFPIVVNLGLQPDACC